MNKKKCCGNSKIYSTIILVFVVCCLMSTSLWAGYCLSWGDCYQLYITRVVVADLDNTSLRDYPTCYSDFTDETANLTQGKTFHVSLTNSRGWDPIYWRIWIDYNGDEDFEDAGEKVFEKSGGNPLGGSFSVPCDTIIGNTRMRVTMGTTFWPPCGAIGYGEVEDYTVNISPNLDLEYTVGNTTVFGSTSTSNNRRALPFTMPEDGTITSVTMYHIGCSCSCNNEMILGVYDGSSTPQNRLAVTATTAVSDSTGWQSICLIDPVWVEEGQKIWLAWVYRCNPGIKYETGTPGRYQFDDTVCINMPDPFGSSSQADYVYSIYASYYPD